VVRKGGVGDQEMPPGQQGYSANYRHQEKAFPRYATLSFRSKDGLSMSMKTGNGSIAFGDTVQAPMWPRLKSEGITSRGIVAIGNNYKPPLAGENRGKHLSPVSSLPVDCVYKMCSVYRSGIVP
jgi:hypothetical protein